MTISEVDTVVTCSNDFFDGRTISSMAIQDACGSYDKNVSTVEGDGAFGAAFALMKVLAGFGTCLFCVHHKGSESVMPLITNAMFDPVYERSLGLDAVTSSAMQARAYMDRYGVSEEDCARVSVKNHGNGFLNPYAQMPLELTVEEVLTSPYIAEPLKLLDCAPISDGASAIILAGREQAGQAAHKPVWVRASLTRATLFTWGTATWPRWTRSRTRRRAPIAWPASLDPAKEIGLAEVYDAFSYMELMWLEGLGLCARGGAGLHGGGPHRAYRCPAGERLRRLPLGHPVLVSGLNRIIECALQVRGDAGAHQVEGVRTAVAQGFNGPCGQSQCVWVLGGEA